MKRNIFLLLILVTVTISCSEDDGSKTSPQFDFLEFEKDVVLPAASARSFSFFAANFDTNINNWEVSLSNQDDENIPISIASVEETPYGYSEPVEFLIQRIILNFPPFGDGDYTLVIKNKTTNQIYTDTFLARSSIFDEVSYENTIDYSLINVSQIRDYFYFQNIINTIQDDVRSPGIANVVLESKTTLNRVDLAFSINPINDKVEFIIPPSVDQGVYYFSVHYDNGLSTYFERDIIVLKEQSPEITSINSNNFNAGEQMVITGKNFRYVPDYTGIDVSDLFLGYLNSPWFIFDSSIMFEGENGLRQLSLDTEEENLVTINSMGGELVFNIPKRKTFRDFLSTDNEQTFFEGEVMIRSSPYVSNAVPIRIDH